MRRLVLDYAHGWIHSAEPTGDVVCDRWTDGLKLFEEDALLQIGNVLERRLSGELGLTPGHGLILTRPDANHIAHLHRLRVANQYLGRDEILLVSLHAHRTAPRDQGHRLTILRPRAGPAPAVGPGSSPADLRTVETWCDVAEIEGYGPMLAARATRIAQEMAGEEHALRAPRRTRIGDWLGGKHLDTEAAELFRDALVPAVVIELALGETDEEVQKALGRLGPLVDPLYRAIEAGVGWGN